MLRMMCLQVNLYPNSDERKCMGYVVLPTVLAEQPGDILPGI